MLATPGNEVPEPIIRTDGSEANIFVGVGSQMANEVTRQAELAFRALFVDTASSQELDRLAFDHYGILRKPASPATGQVTFSRSVGGLPAGSIPTGFRVQSKSGNVYQTTQPTSFALGETVNSAPVESLVAAKGQSALAGTVTVFGDAPFDSNLSVTNADPIAGGADQEDDVAFRERVRRFWLVAERGTLAAIEFGAVTVAGVAKATAIETVEPDGSPARVVRLYISDQDGLSSPTMIAAVKAALKGDTTSRDPLKRGFRAAGINVLVLGGTPALQAVTWKLAFAAGVDELVSSGEIRAATVAYVNSLSPGETLYRSALLAIPRRFAGVIVRDDALQLPIGDVVPGANQVLRTDDASVTFV
jgi:uncharacterized phage protein gp47/JayE